MIDPPADTTPLVIQGDALSVLRSLPDGSAQCVVTSPPYWGQRSYETEAQTWGGDPAHEHEWAVTPPRRPRSAKDAGKNSTYGADPSANYDARGGAACSCGAWRGELGLEPTPELYVDHLVTVFEEARRVLRSDGTCWVNLGGTYATYPSGVVGDRRWAKSWMKGRGNEGTEQSGRFDKRAPGWKAKELVPIPWLFGLRAHEAGWWLRADVQWWKLNGKHENSKDRPYRAHEYVTMLTKGPDPFYNEPAVRQPYVPSTIREIGIAYRNPSKRTRIGGEEVSLYEIAGAQDPSDTKRRIIASLAERGGSMLPDVWYLATGNGEGAHVAVFPDKLPEICITASTRPGDLVLDPFAGSGTTLGVARRLGRRSIGIELNPRYVELARRRSTADVPQLERWTE